MYFERVNWPKVLSPSLKLPRMSITTGQTVRNPTIAIRLGVKTVLVFCITGYPFNSEGWSSGADRTAGAIS